MTIYIESFKKKVGTAYCRNNVIVPVCLIIEIPKVLLEKKLQKTTKSTKKLYATILNSLTNLSSLKTLP